MPPPLSINDYSNLVKCRVKEVVEDRSYCSRISVDKVHDVAFVFHQDTLERTYINCSRMRHVYFTRFYLQGNRLGKVDCHLHLPFSTTCIESYSSRIWHFLLDVKGKVEK